MPRTAGKAGLLAGGLLLWAGAAGTGAGAAAQAAEVSTIAIMTPEQGVDFGWNQQGVESARKAGEQEGVEVIVAEGLGYGDIRPTMRELVADGANLVIAHASGYDVAATEIGEETGTPVAIVGRRGAMTPGKVADYTLSGHEGAYLAGRLAAKMTRSGILGIVVSAEVPAWNSSSAAFAAGAKAEKPDIQLRYAVIGPAAYSDAAGAKRVTQSVIASGADIVFGQGNGSSFGMIQAVETTPAVDGGEVYFIDVIGDKSSLDNDNLLTSVVWDLSPLYVSMIQDLRADQFGTRNYQIHLADDSVRLLHTDNIPDDVWADVMALRDQVVSGAIAVEPVFDAVDVRAMMPDVSAAE